MDGEPATFVCRCDRGRVCARHLWLVSDSPRSTDVVMLTEKGEELWLKDLRKRETHTLDGNL